MEFVAYLFAAGLGSLFTWLVYRDACDRAVKLERERCARIADRWNQGDVAEDIRGHVRSVAPRG